MKPEAKELRGCTNKPLVKALFPPLDLRYDSERIELDKCPIRYLTPDVIELFRTLNLSDCAVSIQSQLSLPYPFYLALAEAKMQQQLANNARAERASANRG